MKILAIRGRNLTSLAGDFVIDLEHGPLGQANLYAITGPTGSGKSTLLDALCLALFDTVPRLVGSPRVTLGEEADHGISANDPRNLLRHGAVEGWAEVDFVGFDHCRYRSRWEVYRARKRAAGCLQAQSMTLRNLTDNKFIGHTKTEVLDAIATRLGLNFDQFCRSVLLAQGEFAAFLKARGKERGELLERITGTELYSQISIAAYDRAKLEKEELQLLNHRVQDLQPLEKEIRANLDSEQETQLAALKTARAVLMEAQRARDWHLHYQRLVYAETMADNELAAATALCSEAASRQKAWQEIFRVQALRVPLAETDRHTKLLDDAEAALAQARVAEERINQASTMARMAFDTARVNWRNAETALEKITPDLLRARLLDARLSDARHQRKLTVSNDATAQRAAQDAIRHYQALLKDQDERERQYAATVEWLGAHAHHAALVEQWPRWDAELRRFQILLAAERSARQDAAVRQHEIGLLTVQLDLARKSLTATQAVLEQTQTELVAREVEAVGQDSTELAHHRLALAETREQLRRHADAVMAICRARQELDAALATHDDAMRDMAAAEVIARRCADELVPMRSAYGEAQSALERATLAASKDVITLRAHLTMNQPCPVCGSLDHPWSHSPGAFNELLDDQRQRVTELGQALEQLTTEQARACASRDNAQRQAHAQQVRVDSWTNELTAAQQVWAAYAVTPLDHIDPDLPERLRRHDEELRGQIDAIIQAEEMARATQSAISAARVAVDAAAHEEAITREKLVHLERALASACERHAAATAEMVRAAREMTVARETLAAPLAGIKHWSSTLDNDPAAFQVRCERDCQAYRQHQERLGKLAQEIATGKIALAGATATVDMTHERAQQTARDAATACSADATLSQERATLLKGQSADSVEKELLSRLDQAQTIEQQANLALHQVEESLIAARTQRTLRADDRELHYQTLKLTHAHLERLLASHQIELSTLRKLLERDSVWLEQERANLDAIERGREIAASHLRERRCEREDYLSSGAPTLTESEIAMALTKATCDEETARSYLADVQFRVRNDDQRCAQSRELLVAREIKEREWKRWEELRELIGSADGVKFRTYAQSLTLEILLGHANRHLEDLARRYHLKRIRNAGLELQVLDRDSGNELRGVHSLSGGETFIVSLALALGLASLSTQNTQVESLFIDEGFGSLDQDTLDTVLAALDALQSQGRKVGIISHVPALTEYIGVQIRVEIINNGRSRVRVLENRESRFFQIST
ncbi:DNA repair protein SbcC/Rad50 [Gammaproteobacteria bacterium]